LASEQAVKEHNLTPLARLAAYGIAGNNIYVYIKSLCYIAFHFKSFYV